MILLFRILFFLSIVGALSSCIVPESTHVKPTFHLLSKTTFDRNESTAVTAKYDEHNNTIDGFPFYLRQVEIPYYLQENRIVYRPSIGEIKFRENDRWGEPLIEGIGRVVGLNLSQLLKSPFYSVYPNRKKISTEWEINITIFRFERVSKNKIRLEVSWEIFNLNFKNGTYPLRNGKVDTLLLIDSVEQKDLSLKDEVQSLSKSLGDLSKLIYNSIVSQNP
jgi:uncharacterized lipoprotein YmbA